MNCQNCKNELHHGEEFCTKCGTRVIVDVKDKATFDTGERAVKESGQFAKIAMAIFVGLVLISGSYAWTHYSNYQEIQWSCLQRVIYRTSQNDYVLKKADGSRYFRTQEEALDYCLIEQKNSPQQKVSTGTSKPLDEQPTGSALDSLREKLGIMD